MAELLLKIGAGSNYEDGDCLCAFDNESIAVAHAARICNLRRSMRNSSGWILPTELSFDWFELTHQYRFRRLSPTEVRRVDLFTGDRDKLGLTPNEAGEAIDVRKFIALRKQNPNNKIFGEDGQEVWFGGRLTYDRLPVLWSRIESKTPLRRNDHQLWSFGRMDLMSHLAIRANVFSRQQVQDFTEPEYEVDDNGEFVWEVDDDAGQEERSGTGDEPPTPDRQWRRKVVRKRRRQIAWRELLGDLNESAKDIEDRQRAVGDIDEARPEGHRYRSKAQPEQPLTRITKKQRSRRR